MSHDELNVACRYTCVTAVNVLIPGIPVKLSEFHSIVQFIQTDAQIFVHDFCIKFFMKKIFFNTRLIKIMINNTFVKY